MPTKLSSQNAIVVPNSTEHVNTEFYLWNNVSLTTELVESASGSFVHATAMATNNVTQEARNITSTVEPRNTSLGIVPGESVTMVTEPSQSENVTISISLNNVNTSTLHELADNGTMHESTTEGISNTTDPLEASQTFPSTIHAIITDSLGVDSRRAAGGLTIIDSVLSTPLEQFVKKNISSSLTNSTEVIIGMTDGFHKLTSENASSNTPVLSAERLVPSSVKDVEAVETEHMEYNATKTIEVEHQMDSEDSMIGIQQNVTELADSATSSSAIEPFFATQTEIVSKTDTILNTSRGTEHYGSGTVDSGLRSIFSTELINEQAVTSSFFDQINTSIVSIEIETTIMNRETSTADSTWQPEIGISGFVFRISYFIL